MDNTKGTPLTAVVGLSLVFSAVAVGVSLSISSMLGKAYVRDEVQKVLAQIEEEKITSQVEANLKPWSLAHKQTIDGRHIYGSPEAEFTLVEFSDLECGFCKRLHETPKMLVEQAKGKINWEWHHFPLQFHDPAATTGAEAAECVGEIAGNQAFWAFTGQWFTQSKMNGQGVENIGSIARMVGAEEKAFTECLNSGKYQQLVKKQIEKGIELGVTGTPGTFVVDNTTGNRLLVKGAQPPQAFLQAVEQLVKMREKTPSQESIPAEVDMPVGESQ
ncbi:DsbA family protein [Aquipseudomonas alcaligenes]|uniref:Protein-disulfide isomerase n=1 Tax=Aquipseudomonas alcaligenes TaxID=43263 RepID=A0A1N6XCV1_AQUAC|nr:DsbA family protein [Pseudomonas alcaligenes]SIR00188.1 Protein-disulfide isomerase [Pseudomonas alcaligenes]